MKPEQKLLQAIFGPRKEPMPRIKVLGGTADLSSPALCHSCRKATIIKGESYKHEVVICGALNHPGDRITFKVTSCSVYDNKNSVSLYEMRQIAWVLQTDEKKRQIGFVPIKSLSSAAARNIQEEINVGTGSDDY